MPDVSGYKVVDNPHYPDMYAIQLPDGTYVLNSAGQPTAWQTKADAENYGMRAHAPGFTAPHFGELGRNLLAHVRLDDRVDAQGKRVLFVEEVQSDWHQRGREEGYKSKELQQQLAEATARRDASAREYLDYFERIRKEHKSTSNFVADFMTGDELEIYRGMVHRQAELSDVARQLDNQLHGAIPPAPFAKTWHELVMKRVLRIAAEEGYDRVAWTTVDNKQIDTILLNK